jgi:hypothetical protein
LEAADQFSLDKFCSEIGKGPMAHSMTSDFVSFISEILEVVKANLSRRTYSIPDHIEGCSKIMPLENGIQLPHLGNVSIVEAEAE